MAAKDNEPSIFDPTGMLFGMQAASIEAWTAAMLRVMNTEEYTRAAGALIDSYLAGSAPFRKLVDSMMAEFVQSETYAASMRALLDSYLASSAPLRQMLEAVMRQGLASMAEARGLAPNFAGWLDPLGMLPAMRGAMLENWMGQSPPAIVQQMLEQSMTQVLVQLNMPTRTDVTSISDRLNQLDLRLDEIEARLDKIAGEPRKPSAPRKRTSG